MDQNDSENDGRVWVEDGYKAKEIGPPIRHVTIMEIVPKTHPLQDTRLKVRVPGEDEPVDARIMHGDGLQVGTVGEIVETEQVWTHRPTLGKFVRGSYYVFRPFWYWRAIPTILPTNRIAMTERQSREYGDPTAEILADFHHIQHLLTREIAPEFIARAMVTGRAKGMDDIYQLAMAYLVNLDRPDLVLAIFIDSAKVVDWYTIEYTLRVERVPAIDMTIIHPYHIDHNQQCTPPFFVGLPRPHFDDGRRFDDPTWTPPAETPQDTDHAA